MTFDLIPYLTPFVHHFVDAALMAIAGLVVSLLVQLLRKLNLHLSEVQEARVRYYAQSAARYAEERIEALIKAGLVNVQDSASKKLNTAVVALVEKVPGLSVPQAEALIKTELPAIGLGAASDPLTLSSAK